MQREIPLPNEIIDMIIDELCDYRKTLKLCALINSHWLGRTRVYLFKTLYIEGHKRGKTLVLRRTPERLEKEVSPLARNSVKRLVLNNRVGIYDIKDDQVCMNANLVLYFLMLLPNVDHLALSASHLGRPDTGRRLIHKPERQRHLKCLEISDIRVGADSDNVSDDNVSDSSSSDNGFDYEGSALHNFLSLFSEIDMMFLRSTSVSSEGTIGRSYIRSLPVIHRLTLGDYVEDAWVFGVFCGYEPSRLRSLTELHLRIWPESTRSDRAVRFDTIVREVGRWVPRLKLCLYDILSAELHCMVGDDTVPDTGLVACLDEYLLKRVVTWDLSPALEELTIQCEICCAAEVELRMRLVVMPMMISLLRLLAKSERACKFSKTPLRLTLELERFDAGYDDLLLEGIPDYCGNTPWEELRTVLLDLKRHDTIRLEHVTIRLSRCDVERIEVLQAKVGLEEGIRNMGLNFVELIVSTESTGDRWPTLWIPY